MHTRLNKFLAEAGLTSRRGADALISEGRVTVNGEVAVAGQKVSSRDEVCLDGDLVGGKRKPIYIAYHKPVGQITTTDISKPNSVIAALNTHERVFPVGRLDVESSGLLLLTNDGALANELTHPRYRHEKEYEVKVDRPLTDAFLDAMATGVDLEDGKTGVARVEPIAMQSFTIVLKEGRNRQIRRMCEALGFEVLKLKRTRVKNIYLGKLKPGQSRRIVGAELKKLKGE